MESRARETIIGCMRDVDESWDDSYELHQPLETLATITKVSPVIRNLLSQTDGAILTILTLSKSTTHPTIIQTLALSILFNLSLNPNLKILLAQLEDSTIIYHINCVILTPRSVECGKLAASLLCSLAMLDKNKAKFGVSYTIQVLVKAISGPRSLAFHHLLSSLAELVQFHGNCTLAVRAGAVQMLMTIAERNEDEDLSGTSLAIIGLLARFEEGLNELKRTDQVMARMIVMLQEGCMISKEGACEILLRLFDDSENCLREAARLPEFSSVLADVSVRSSGRVREKAGLIMKKIMDANLY